MLPESFGEANFQCMSKSAGSALQLKHRPIALLNSDYKIDIRDFLVLVAADSIVFAFSSRAGYLPKRSIRSAHPIFSSVREAANFDSDLHEAIFWFFNISKVYDTLQLPNLL